MHAEAQRRLGHALQAIRSIQTYTADAPLPGTRSGVVTPRRRTTRLMAHP
jgi:hypothetical protein